MVVQHFRICSTVWWGYNLLEGRANTPIPSFPCCSSDNANTGGGHAVDRGDVLVDDDNGSDARMATIRNISQNRILTI